MFLFILDKILITLSDLTCFRLSWELNDTLDSVGNGFVMLVNSLILLSSCCLFSQLTANIELSLGCCHSRSEIMIIKTYLDWVLLKLRNICKTPLVFCNFISDHSHFLDLLIFDFYKDKVWIQNILFKNWIRLPSSILSIAFDDFIKCWSCLCFFLFNTILLIMRWIILSIVCFIIMLNLWLN